MAGLLITLGTGLLLPSCSTSNPTEKADNISISVPGVVLQAFKLKYPDITPTWSARPYGYEAAFLQDGLEYEAEYSPQGEWLETEYIVQASQFPPNVLQHIQREFPNHVIIKYEIELTPKGTFYEVEIRRDAQERELYFDDRASPTINTHEDA